MTSHGLTMQLSLLQSQGVPKETRANRWRNGIYLMLLRENHNILLGNDKEFFALKEKLVSDPFTLWNSHKAYIRGVFIKMRSVAKKCRTQQLNDLLKPIHTLGVENKKQSPMSISFFKASKDVRLLLISQYDNHLRTLRSNHYCLGNKVGKLLVNQVKEKAFKQRIPYLYPLTSEKLINPKYIADAFSAYFSKL